MNYLRLIFLVMLIVSCASNKKESKNTNEDQVGLDGVTNQSFKMPNPKKYQKIDDFLESGLSEEDNVLSSESLSKLPAEDVEEPSRVDDKLKKALVACYKSDFKLSDKLFDNLYREYRENPIYWTQVGTCFLIRGSKRKALLFFNKAKALKGNYPPPVNNIGVIFQKEGFDQKALKAYEEAKSMSSFSLTPLFNIAQIYTKYGLVEEGRNLFETLININAKDQDSLYALGFLEFSQGQLDLALSRFNQLDRSYYTKPEVGVNVAYALALAGEQNEAKDIIEELRPTSNKDLANYIARVRRFIGI